MERPILAGLCGHVLQNVVRHILRVIEFGFTARTKHAGTDMTSPYVLLEVRDYVKATICSPRSAEEVFEGVPFLEGASEAFVSFFNTFPLGSPPPPGLILAVFPASFLDPGHIL